MSFAYFAYGSNMLPARLQARCSTARVMGPATATGFGLDFSKAGKDGSGKATLVQTAARDVATPGVLYEIDRGELPRLDDAESAGIGYDRHDDFAVTCATSGETLAVTSYIARAINPDLAPFDWYLALVLAGSHHHSLHDDHLKRLRAFGHLVDTDHTRQGRIEALEALTLHGYADYHALLSDPKAAR